MDWAREAGHDELQLWVTEVNDGARGLYETSGFVATADVEPLRSDPALMERRMTRRL